MGFSQLLSPEEKAAHWQLAVHFLVSMYSVNVVANVVTFNAAISACGGGGDGKVKASVFRAGQSTGCS